MAKKKISKKKKTSKVSKAIKIPKKPSTNRKGDIVDLVFCKKSNCWRVEVTKDQFKKIFEGKKRICVEEYSIMLVEHMSKGYSFEAFGAVVYAGKETLYIWLKEYPFFANAKKVGESLSRLFWEGQAINNLLFYKDGQQIQPAIWIFNMRNRFGWTDRQEIEIGDESKKLFKLSYNLDE